MGKHVNFHFIKDVLTDDERQMIDRILAIEDIWWGRWHDIIDNDGDVKEHWFYAGEDAFFVEEKNFEGIIYTDTNLYIDMRGRYYPDSLTGEMIEIGYVAAERIIPWEKGVVPRAVNVFTKRFFGVKLFGYQLAFYYQVTPKMMIVGGRGSAKTSAEAVVMAIWAAIHPGQAWAHFAFSSAQALEAYYIIHKLGANRIPVAGMNVETAPKSFFEVFVLDSKTSPNPEINFNRWDTFDSGNKILFRPIGAKSGGANVRSIDVRRGSLDEVTKDIPDKKLLGVAEGTIRGTNHYWYSRLSEEDAKKVDEARILAARFDELYRSDQLTDEQHESWKHINRFLREKRISCHLGAIRTGNRGNHVWVDEDLARSMTHPEEIYARVVSYLINPFLDAQARRQLEATYPDPRQARQELFGERALGEGEFFSVPALMSCEVQAMDERMQAALNAGERGHQMLKYQSHLVHWQLPYNPKRIYVLGSDPGTGTVPRRDSWTVLVFELDLVEVKARLAYLRWGNIPTRRIGTQKKGWLPYIKAQTEALDLYSIDPADAVVQVGGAEAGIQQVAYIADQRVSSIPMTRNTKATWANWTRQLISKGVLQWPHAGASLTAQLSDWKLKDDAIAQDLVMALFAVSSRTFYYMHHLLKPVVKKKRVRTPRYRRWTGRSR